MLLPHLNKIPVYVSISNVTCLCCQHSMANIRITFDEACHVVASSSHFGFQLITCESLRAKDFQKNGVDRPAKATYQFWSEQTKGQGQKCINIKKLFNQSGGPKITIFQHYRF